MKELTTEQCLEVSGAGFIKDIGSWINDLAGKVDSTVNSVICTADRFVGNVSAAVTAVAAAIQLTNTK